MNKKEILEYWLKSADIDYKTMQYLFKGKDYSWSLFIGHIVVEKLLKAYYVKKILMRIRRIYTIYCVLPKKQNLISQRNRKIFLIL